MTGAEDLS